MKRETAGPSVAPRRRAAPAPRRLAVPKSDYVRARIATPLKHEAEAVLAAMGLTMSDAMRLMLVRVVEDRRLPFDLPVPNERTIAAIEASRSGKVTRVSTIAALLEDLDG